MAAALDIEAEMTGRLPPTIHNGAQIELLAYERWLLWRRGGERHE